MSGGDGFWLPVPGADSSLAGLSDVDLTTTPPVDGDSLVFDGASGTWMPGTPAATVAAFHGVVLEIPNQAIPTGTTTPLTSTTETFDTDGLHSNAANTSRITIPAGLAGYWMVGGSCMMNSLNDSHTYQLGLRKNGAGISGTAAAIVGANNSFPGLVVARPVQLSAGDYVELVVTHFYGSSRNTNGGNFWAYLLGS